MKYEAPNVAMFDREIAEKSGLDSQRSTVASQHPGIRILDILISLAVLVFILPVFAVVAVVVKLQDNGPILFSHGRIGMQAGEFKCLKFRSMYVKSDEILNQLLMTNAEAYMEWQADHKLRNDPRVTPFGRIMRKTSLDEFPQLINVLKGEMSLVGPRPIIHAEISKYGRSFRHYTSVMPGITGLWQVMGRNDISYRRRVAMDRLFARKKSLGLYVWILFKTIPAVLAQRGSY
jgi:lipopolysaccharide/colanic/teichoic acid biosynthesis glycosyltransferase